MNPNLTIKINRSIRHDTRTQASTYSRIGVVGCYPLLAKKHTRVSVVGPFLLRTPSTKAVLGGADENSTTPIP